MATNAKTPSLLMEVKLDFILSIRLLLENWKSFISTEIFSIIASVSIAIPVFSLIYIFNAPDFFLLIAILSLFFFIPIFLCSQYGLVYDILSSGYMYTDFKSSFAYFKRFWWQYTFLMLVINILPGWIFSVIFQTQPLEGVTIIESESISIVLSPMIFSIYDQLRYIWLCIIDVIFIFIYPGLIAQESLKRSLSANFRLINNNKKRVFITWGLFSLMFQIIPQIVLGGILYLKYNDMTFAPIIPVLFWLTYPMYTLITTRMYNTLNTDLKD